MSIEECCEILEEAQKMKRYKDALVMLMKEWECCAEVAKCTGLGYPKNEWCTYCICEDALKGDSK